MLKNESKLTKWSLLILGIILTLYFMEPARAEVTVEEIVEDYIDNPTGFGMTIIASGVESYVFGYSYAIANVKVEAGLVADDNLADTTVMVNDVLLSCDALQGSRQDIVKRWMVHATSNMSNTLVSYQIGIMHFVISHCSMELDAAANWIFESTTKGDSIS